MSERPRVLIVDDSPDDRFKVRWMLKRSRPVELFEAETLEQALTLWKAHHPDLVLLDLNLDQDNGAELLRQVKYQAGVGATVAVLSGIELVPRADELHRLGVERFIAKEDLTQTVLDRFIADCYEALEQDATLKRQEFVLLGACNDLADDLVRVNESLAQGIQRLGDDTPSSRLMKSLANQRLERLNLDASKLQQLSRLAFSDDQDVQQLDPGLSNLQLVDDDNVLASVPVEMTQILKLLLRFLDKHALKDSKAVVSVGSTHPPMVGLECRGVRLPSRYLNDPSQMQFLGAVNGVSGALNAEWPEAAARARLHGVAMEFAADADLGIRLALKLSEKSP